MAKNKFNNKTKQPRRKTITNINVNRYSLVRVVGDNEGEMSGKDALAFAEKNDVSLVIMSDEGTIPICKFINEGKERYKQKKRAKEAKAASKKTKLQEIKLGKIDCDVNEMNWKSKQAANFITTNGKVKVSVAVPGGRAKYTRKYEGPDVLEKFLGYINAVEGIKWTGVFEDKPRPSGNNWSVIVKAAPIKKLKTNKNEA